MTIDSKYAIELYREDGGTSYPFRFESLDGQLAVESIAPNGDRTLIPSSEYAVIYQGVGPIFQRGEINLLSPISTGNQLFIKRSTFINNEQVFEAGKPFQPEAFEFAIDKVTMIPQELEGHLCDCSSEITDFVAPPYIVEQPDDEGPS